MTICQKPDAGRPGDTSIYVLLALAIQPLHLQKFTHIGATLDHMLLWARGLFIKNESNDRATKTLGCSDAWGVRPREKTECDVDCGEPDYRFG